jgi:hypothetical protein
MSEAEMRAEIEEDEISVAQEVSVSRYPGRDTVMVRTTELPGEEPSREERIRAVLRRLAQEGWITLPS